MCRRPDRRRGPPKLQFHQFSTGNRHPGAANYCLELDQVAIARATCMECCGDNMVAVILDGERMGDGNGDYIFLIEWRVGRITQASTLIIQRQQHPDMQISFKLRSLERMVLWSPFYPVISSCLASKTLSRFKFAS